MFSINYLSVEGERTDFSSCMILIFLAVIYGGSGIAKAREMINHISLNTNNCNDFE